MTQDLSPLGTAMLSHESTLSSSSQENLVGEFGAVVNVFTWVTNLAGVPDSLTVAPVVEVVVPATGHASLQSVPMQSSVPLIFPATSSFSVGVVPMPTLPMAVILTFSFMYLKVRSLLDSSWRSQ